MLLILQQNSIRHSNYILAWSKSSNVTNIATCSTSQHITYNYVLLLPFICPFYFVNFIKMNPQYFQIFGYEKSRGIAIWSKKKTFEFALRGKISLTAKKVTNIKFETLGYKNKMCNFNI